jgi:hypothetical protein
MPGRSGRDEKQAPAPADEPEAGTFAGVMHQFGKSLGLVKDPPPPKPDGPTPPPTSTTPPSTTIGGAAKILQDRGKTVDAAVDDMSK